MEVVLMSCCAQKAEGGIPKYQDPLLKAGISSASFQRLQDLRKNLSQKLPPEQAEGPGSDLGSSGLDNNLFLTAYQRYTGIVFQRGQVKALLPQAKNRKILIISALYGLLDAFDWIRNYNLTMKDKLANGKKVQTYWKQNGLRKLVEEYIRSLGPTIVHDLLPLAYRAALEPWPPRFSTSAGIEYRLYDYPGEGMGSLWHRGDDLARILGF